MQEKLDLRPFRQIVDRVASAYERRDAATAAFETAKQQFRQAFGGKTFLDELRRVKYACLSLWQNGMWFSAAADGPQKTALINVMDETDRLIRRLELEN